MQTKEEILKQCTVEGLVVKLPAGQLDRKLYQDVAKALELIGGKWKGNKIMGFVFQTDPRDLLSEIAGGEKRNLKKEFQFFATPSLLADELVFQAQVEPWHDVLEPSAGQGAIIEAILRIQLERKNPIDYCELMPVNQLIMEKKIKGGLNAKFINADFLTLEPTKRYDRIIANPPFQNNQDIAHIMRMYDFLKPGGILVSVASTHWQKSENRKEIEFRDWLKSKKNDIDEVPAGSFKESGTNVAGVIVIINKSKFSVEV